MSILTTVQDAVEQHKTSIDLASLGGLSVIILDWLPNFTALAILLVTLVRLLNEFDVWSDRRKKRRDKEEKRARHDRS